MQDSYILALLIFAPALASFLPVFIFRRPTSWAQIIDAFSLHPSLGLAKHWLFWWSLYTPAFYFFAFGYFCWEGHALSISAEGYKEFIAISAFPLGLLSLSIPLGVIVARFHSTQQTAEQIQLARQKNNPDAFYSHRKEFFYYFEKVGKQTFLDAIVLRYDVNPKLHGVLFIGGAEDGTPILDKHEMLKIIGYLDHIRNKIDLVLHDTEPTETLYHYSEIARSIYWIANFFGIKEIKHELYKSSPVVIGATPLGKPISQRSLGTTTGETIAAYRCIKSYLLTVLHFAGAKDLIEKVYEFDIDYIDINGQFMNIMPGGPIIERGFASIPSQWKWATI